MKTNLYQIKSTAKALFMAVEIKPVKNMPFVVQHPFTNSSMVCVPNDTHGLVDYLKEKNTISSEMSTFVDITTPKGQIVFRNVIFKMIDGCKNVMEIIILLNKSYYMTFLKYTQPYLSSEDFGSLLGECWIVQEYPNRDNNVSINELISWFKKADKEHLMNPAEFKMYNDLKTCASNPGIVLYRGISYDGKPNGLSWTTDIDRAKWFAERWKGFRKANPKVYKITIHNPDYILAYLNGRGENEVILDTSVAKDWEIIE